MTTGSRHDSQDSHDSQDDVRATERWFLDHGLPFFVEGRSITLDDLVRGRSLVVLVLAFVAMAAIVPSKLPAGEAVTEAGAATEGVAGEPATLSSSGTLLKGRTYQVFNRLRRVPRSSLIW